MAEEDILYGKNRHLFGGIEPSNMKKFECVERDGRQVLICELPDDTVIDGQTLCTVGGAVIRAGIRTIGKEYMPKDEFDGIFVADIDRSQELVIDLDEISNGSSVDFRAFPYSAQGVYNRNMVNMCTSSTTNVQPVRVLSVNSVYNPYRETSEDEPSYSGVKVSFINDTKKDVNVRVYVWSKPSDSYYWLGNSKILTTVKVEAGDTSIHTIEKYFTRNNLGHGVITDPEGHLGLTYYIGVVTCDAKNYVEDPPYHLYPVLMKRYNYLYGYDLNTNDENPEIRVTYPNEVMNKGYAPAYMDFERDVFNYGSWDLQPGEHFMPKPCMVSYTGEVAHYLDPNDYSKQEDGVSPSLVTDVTYNGNAMMEWPKIYTKRWTDSDGIYHFRCSDQKLDEEYECWCNYDENDKEIDHFYTSIYSATVTTTTRSSVGYCQPYRSLSGRDAATSADHATGRDGTVVSYDNVSQYKLGWDIAMFADHLLIQDLLVMIGKSTDVQTVFGYGLGSGASPIQKTGTMDSKGMFWGRDNYKDLVKVFGMENLWGNYSYTLAGWVYYDNKHYVKLTRGNYDITVLNPENHVDASGSSNKWKRFGISNASYFTNNILAIGAGNFTGGSSTGGYISAMYTERYGRMPYELNGSATTYECDVVSLSSSTSIRAFATGVISNSNTERGTTQNGIFVVSLQQSGTHRLSLKPTI